MRTAPVAAGSMLASYVVASRVRSDAGAVVLMAGGLGWCATTWRRDHGPARSAALSAVHLAAFGLSHPLARHVGAWPAVLGATAATGVASYAAADRVGA